MIGTLLQSLVHRIHGSGETRIKAGDIVRVLPYDRISKTLDENDCHGGLLFMPNMVKYCEREFRVLKPVRWIFDERNKEMLSCRDIIVLSGPVCDGEGMLDGKDCDRCCTLLWKTAWVKSTSQTFGDGRSQAECRKGKIVPRQRSFPSITSVEPMGETSTSKRPSNMDNASSNQEKEAAMTREFACQYTCLDRLGHKFSVVEKYWQLALRIPPALRRRLSKYSMLLLGRRINELPIDTGDHRGDGEKPLKMDLASGDIVHIKPYGQIACTLNRMAKYKGLNFLPGMKRYCGQESTVLKKPRYVLDGGGKVIRECKDIVILNGLYCNGKGLVSDEGCDRCCLYYWKRDWLEKVDGNEKSCLEEGSADR